MLLNSIRFAYLVVNFCEPLLGKRQLRAKLIVRSVIEHLPKFIPRQVSVRGKGLLGLGTSINELDGELDTNVSA
jgi:hypothetical protein